LGDRDGVKAEGRARRRKDLTARKRRNEEPLEGVMRVVEGVASWKAWKKKAKICSRSSRGTKARLYEHAGSRMVGKRVGL
jgi:hypothetical protein